VDPRTFLPGPAIATVAPPRVDGPAPGLDGRDLRSSVVAFLRHTGCPFAEATARELTAHAGRAADVRWVAVSHATGEATRTWCAAVGLEGVDVVVDHDRSLYAAWGLGRTSLAHFMGWRSLRAVAGVARAGIRNRHPSGTRWQAAGSFAVDADGIVRWRHLPSHAGDLPDLDAAALAAGA
jgi:hypothetical protein